eukprot:6179379-Pleurochrysis_carterae.AAC.1
MPAPAPRATLRKNPGAVGLRSALNTSPPSQYSSTRQNVGGEMTHPRYCTTFGWRSLAKRATSACHPSSEAKVVPATLTATRTPFQRAAYVVPATPAPMRRVKWISSSPMTDSRAESNGGHTVRLEGEHASST